MRRITIIPIVLAACAPAEPADEVDATGDDTDATDTVPAEPAPVIDPTCLDGQWVEALPDRTADLSATIAGFSPEVPAAFLSAALSLRYPVGGYLFNEGMTVDPPGQCLNLFTAERDRRDADGMLHAASTLVHECGHFFDMDRSTFVAHAFIVTDEARWLCRGGSYETTPARSRIKGDAWNDLRPPCPAQGDHGCDGYAQIYLNGDPDNRTFESGDQGLDMVLEEALQYINSLATDYAFVDHLGSYQISALDGILTYLWYTERYLAYMRAETPAVWREKVDDPCWREVILTVWGRAWLMIEAARDIDKLGLEDADLMELVLDPFLLQEIHLVREAQGC